MNSSPNLQVPGAFILHRFSTFLALIRVLAHTTTRCSSIPIRFSKILWFISMSDVLPSENIWTSSVEVASICLRRHQWNVQRALDAFWDNPASFVPPPPACDVGLLETMFSKYKGIPNKCMLDICALRFCKYASIFLLEILLR